jgi:hypothetical protein
MNSREEMFCKKTQTLINYFNKNGFYLENNIVLTRRKPRTDHALTRTCAYHSLLIKDNEFKNMFHYYYFKYKVLGRRRMRDFSDFRQEVIDIMDTNVPAFFKNGYAYKLLPQVLNFNNDVLVFKPKIFLKGYIYDYICFVSNNITD